MGEFLAFAIFMALAMAAHVVVDHLRGRRAEQRASRLEQEGRTDLSVRVRGTAEPYPRKWHAGRLRISGRSAVWHPRRGTPLAIHGLQVLRTRLAGSDDRVEGRFNRFSDTDFVILLARDSRGAVVELAVTETDARLLDGYLRGDIGLPDMPAGQASAEMKPRETLSPLTRLERRLPIWALAAGAAAVVWLLGAAVLLGAGKRIDALVLVNDSDYDICTVEWVDPWDGSTRNDTVDCYGEKSGEEISVQVMGWPLRREAVDPSEASIIVPVVAVVLLGVAGFGFVSRRRERRSLEGSGLSDLPVGPVPQNHVAAPVLDAIEEVTYSRVAEVMTARSQAEAWAARHARDKDAADIEWPDAVPRHWWSVPALRRHTRAGMWTAAMPMAIAVVALLSGYPWWATSVHLATASTATATATVEDVYDDGIPFVPWNADVTFEGSDAEIATATVAAFDIERGDTVRVEYDVHDPGHARLVGGGQDGLARGAWITGLVALAALGFAGWRTASSARLARMLWHRRALPPQPVRYVVLPTTEGSAGLALFPTVGDVPPTVLLPLADDVRGSIPVAGVAQAHGEVVPGELLVVETAGLVLWPIGPTEEADPEIVRDAVNGVLIGDDEED